MKVVIRHPSGAMYEGPARHAERWWATFATPEVVPTPPEPADEEAPKVVGVDGGWSGPQLRDFEYGANSRHQDMPVVNASAKPHKFGFVRNEENK